MSFNHIQHLHDFLLLRVDHKNPLQILLGKSKLVEFNGGHPYSIQYLDIVGLDLKYDITLFNA